MGTAVPLFLTGMALAYLSLGRPMHYLLGLTPDGVANIISVDEYMSFVMAMLLAFGVAFLVPLGIVMLNLAGVLTHERFRKWRRMMIFAVFVIAGMANPSPDPVTLLILGGACAALVEAAECLVWSHDRRRARAHRPLCQPGRRPALPPPTRPHRHPQPAHLTAGPRGPGSAWVAWTATSVMSLMSRPSSAVAAISSRSRRSA